MQMYLRKLTKGLVRRSRSIRPYEEQFLPMMDLPPYDGPVRTYLIASTPRSGSHFLGHALSACRGFGVPLEYLNKGNLAGWEERFGTSGMENIWPFLLRHRSSEDGDFGLKAHWAQFRDYADSGLPEPVIPTRAIWIYRRDLLSQAISFLKARQTGQWISGAPKRAEERYDYDSLVSCAEDLRAQNDGWRGYFARRSEGFCKKVVYEDMIDQPEDTLAEVAEFLKPGSAVGPPVPERTKKQAGGSSEHWRRRFISDLAPSDKWVLEPQVF